MATTISVAARRPTIQFPAFAGADFHDRGLKGRILLLARHEKTCSKNRNGYVENAPAPDAFFEPGATGSDGKINGIFEGEYNCPDNNRSASLYPSSGQSFLLGFSFGADKQIVLGGLLLTGLAEQKEPFSFHRRRALYHRCGLYQKSVTTISTS